ATAGMSGTKPIVSVLDEVKDGTQDVMLELKVHSNRAGMLGYRSHYRDGLEYPIQNHFRA
ncbi:hypothetical protein MJN51_32280, partial [Salmonella enterica subsp. enterica serovar Kentucky]|nr:hypothetical protein [Salmonella enterica subsp. enterica serovar Kentucky]